MKLPLLIALLLVVLIFLGCHRLTAHDEQSAAPPEAPEVKLQRDLVGYWKLQGDCRDSSGRNNHSANHGVDLKTSRVDGRSAYVEVPHYESLQLGFGDCRALSESEIQTLSRDSQR